MAEEKEGEEMKVDGKNVFLSGPVTGRERDEVLAEFEEAEEICNESGAFNVYVPINEVSADATHEQAMLECLHELTSAYNASNDPSRYVPTPYYDVLVQLPGWKFSFGCITEATVAMMCGIPCIELSEVE